MILNLIKYILSFNDLVLSKVVNGLLRYSLGPPSLYFPDLCPHFFCAIENWQNKKINNRVVKNFIWYLVYGFLKFINSKGPSGSSIFKTPWDILIKQPNFELNWGW
jgi:hypothetical protein